MRDVIDTTFKKLIVRVTVIVAAAVCIENAAAGDDFPIIDPSTPLSIIVGADEPETVSVAAAMLADDLEALSGLRQPAISDLPGSAKHAILIGTIDGELTSMLRQQGLIDTSAIRGKWECYIRLVVQNPFAGVDSALVIIGSDKRGAAYGVVDLTRELGVSAWSWWADVPIQEIEKATIHAEQVVSKSPSVKYRGIFLNDEDWGLQPWSATTFEPEVGDIGPKSYAKIFELLLRLKANTIWPAMHPSTRAFYHYKDNPEVADSYGIVIGSSHAEPMLRNNVDEWDHSARGEFNYLSNRSGVLDYWEERVKQSHSFESIYTLGMRGIHDSPMVGADDMQSTVTTMEQIIDEQRKLLQSHSNKSVTQIPQVLTPYKEVLNIYDAGLNVPEDVALVWPDDNHGYIRRLSSVDERLRSGGAGVYYHMSYWGSPHDYLWLSSTHPALIRTEMMRAYDLGSQSIWVGNVGDIKPLEYNTQLFLDMAFDAESFRKPSSIQRHLRDWLSSQFGESIATEASEILWEYHALAWQRRPEFMGWSRVEPRTVASNTKLSHHDFGDEAAGRLQRYANLEQRALELSKSVPTSHRASFFQLIQYPVVAAANMNRKFLYSEKATLAATQRRLSASEYASSAMTAYNNIQQATTHYNALLNGKWHGMMSMSPRGLAAFRAPARVQWDAATENEWGLIVEGTHDVAYYSEEKGRYSTIRLPSFVEETHRAHFFDVFLTGRSNVRWHVESDADWLIISDTDGVLRDAARVREQRIWVSIDWDKLPTQAEGKATIQVAAGGSLFEIRIDAYHRQTNDSVEYVEDNGIISIHAESLLSSTGSSWERIDGLGYTGAVIRPATNACGDELTESCARANYRFRLANTGPANVLIYALPTHPAASEGRMRVRIAIDGEAVGIVDFSEIPRSPQWSVNVLRNAAIGSVEVGDITAGEHTLSLDAIDPDVLIDRIEIETRSVGERYSSLPETRSQ